MPRKPSKWNSWFTTCLCTVAVVATAAVAGVRGGAGPVDAGGVTPPQVDELAQGGLQAYARSLSISLQGPNGDPVAGADVSARTLNGAMIKAVPTEAMVNNRRATIYHADIIGNKTVLEVAAPWYGEARVELAIPQGSQDVQILVVFTRPGVAEAIIARPTTNVAPTGGGVAGPCPGNGDCCVANGDPGCDDAACCAKICDLDPFCCDNSWDTICAGEAADFCTVCGGVNSGACCLPDESCVELDGGTCAGLGGIFQGLGTLCSGVSCVSVCPGDGDCCVANGSPGCDDATCCDIVCAADAFCCDNTWDSICAGEAVDLCGDLCPVTGACCLPDGSCLDAILDTDCALFGGIFQGAFTDCATSFCPCSIDCDPAKIPEGEPDCGLPTDTVNGGCNTAPPMDSDCCFANGSPGCDDATCEGIVCAADPFCCDNTWDSICAGEAADLCGDLCAVVPVFTDIECGDGVCGTAAVDLGIGLRDTDWYRVVLTEDTILTWSVTAEFESVSGLIEYVPGSEGSGDCGDITGFIAPFVVGSVCGEKVSVTTDCLPSGTYFLFVAVASFAQDVACGAEYTATLTCEDCSPPEPPENDECADAIAIDVPSLTSGDTTLAQADPGAPNCETTVAAPGIWYSVIGTGSTITASTCFNDGNGSADYDTKIHVYCGECPGATSDCCFANGSPGCDDATCEGIVCALDAFCCDNTWDSICAGEAADNCGDLCNTGGGLECVASNDDSPNCGFPDYLSTVSWCSQEGAEYKILVNGFGGATGSFTMELTDDGVPCTADVACLPQGACCFQDGSCIVTTSTACDSQGGTYAGDDTDCGTNFYRASECANSFEDISGTGTQLALGDDDGEVVPIGFTFNFWKDDHTDISVASNGYLTFGTDQTDLSEDDIPSTTDPNDLIAVLWDDLDPGNAGSPATVHYQTLGAAGSQRFIVQWTDVPEFPDTGANTFQAVLYEGSNCVELRYLAITTSDFTAGVENQDGTQGTQVDGLVAEGACISLCPKSTGSPCPQPGACCLGSDCVDLLESKCLQQGGEWQGEGTNCATTSCLTYRTLIIKGGACPAPYNSNGNGVTPMVLAGEADFDVNTIDVSTLQLSRCDGVGGSIAPNMGPVGPGIQIVDNRSPSDDPATCDNSGCNCDNALVQSDGIDDMMLKFKTAQMATVLGLNSEPTGSIIPLELTGETTGGDAFSATDCVWLVGPAGPPGLLLVGSNLPQVWADVTPTDDQLDAGGFTSFGRSYTQGTFARVTAPVAPVNYPGYVLHSYYIDGTEYFSPGGATVEVDVLIGQSTSLVFNYVLQTSIGGKKGALLSGN